MIKRTVNKKLLDQSRSWACVIDGTIDGTAAHHVQSVGSRGPDIVDNLMPLNRRWHVGNGDREKQCVHKIGLRQFAEDHPEVRRWLLDHGWEFCDIFKRWFRVWDE